MKLYECTRYSYTPEGKNSWMGSLLIFADNEEEAKKFFQEFERGDEPGQVIERKIEKGVLYDDYMR